jgi:hypothetical protein
MDSMYNQPSVNSVRLYAFEVMSCVHHILLFLIVIT